MADSTKVNELQENLLKAMSIVNNKLLSSISYDKTIIATITDDSYREQGKYTVSDGTRTFVAYSTVTNYTNNTTVYITIPNGDWENQKMIVGKKTAENNTPFIFTQPFDTIFDETDNIVDKISSETYSLLANGDEKEVLIKEFDLKDNPIAPDFTRLGLSADFRSWISSAIQGTYGLTIALRYKSLKTTDSDDAEVYTDAWAFNTTEMYGNVYNFDTYYNQQKVFDISELGTITGIQLKFFQNQDFVDSNGEKLSTTDDIGTEYIANLFCKNIYICAGNDISAYKDDVVNIYTLDKTTYNKKYHGESRTIKLRWVHIKDGTPTKMTDKFETWLEDDKEKHKIKWYRYEIGEKAADDYCGVYWTEIEENRNKTEIGFTPNTEWQQEKVKAIIFEDTNIAYRSNELFFNNEEEVPDYNTLQYENALEIITDDGSNGNYMVYRQDYDLIDEIDYKEARTLSLKFDVDMDKTAESTVLQDNKVTWTIPIKNSMLQFEGSYDTSNDIATISGECPKYTIRRYFSYAYNNNTITCTYTLNGRTYTTEKEFTFGPQGTMGAEETLVIDFNGDQKSVTIGEQKAEFVVNLYDSSNKPQTIPNKSCRWFYIDKDMSTEITLEEQGNSTYTWTKDFSHEQLNIIGVEVGDLKTYFAVPIRTSGYAYISGATQVIYQTTGEPSYCKDTYCLYKYTDKEKKLTVQETATWDIIGGDSYKANIKNNRLQPIEMFISDTTIYGVTASVGNSTVWTQPILVYQNRWASNVINKWSGKEITIDNVNNTILASAMAAGKKENDGSFSGVMLGSWKDTDTNSVISSNTGVYGFNKGQTSYAFMDDGTAFIGKSGYGRINFNGNYATIYSSGYENSNNPTGMKIDLQAPSLDMRYTNNSYIKMNFSSGYPQIRVQSENSTFLLSGRKGSSKIEMSGEKSGKSGTIILNSSSDDDPLTIGKYFYVEWDGTLHATSGVFKGTINADSGYLKDLSIEGAITIDKGGSLNLAADKWDTDGPIYIKYNTSKLGSIGVIRGRDGDTGKETINMGILGESYRVNGYYPSIVFESQRNIRLSAQEQIFLNGNRLSCNVPKDNQTGIYARFA